MKQELEVLLQQLDELLIDGAVDGEDALEIAVVAGLVSRLEPEASMLHQAEGWRNGPGGDLLSEVWSPKLLADAVDGVEGVANGEADEHEVEEALFEFDEWIAAAVWCGQQDMVRQAANQVAETVRMIPDSFAPVADLGAEMARLPAVAQELELYAFWMHVADAAKLTSTDA